MGGRSNRRHFKHREEKSTKIWRKTRENPAPTIKTQQNSKNGNCPDNPLHQRFKDTCAQDSERTHYKTMTKPTALHMNCLCVFTWLTAIHSCHEVHCKKKTQALVKDGKRIQHHSKQTCL